MVKFKLTEFSLTAIPQQMFSVTKFAFVKLSMRDVRWLPREQLINLMDSGILDLLCYLFHT